MTSSAQYLDLHSETLQQPCSPSGTMENMTQWSDGVHVLGDWLTCQGLLEGKARSTMTHLHLGKL